MKESDLLLKIKSDDHKVLIYGAGMVGSLVFQRLLSGGIPKERIVFVVSNPKKGNNFFLGQKIYAIHECRCLFENVHIIISTLSNAHEGIIQTLHENNYFDFDIVDDILFNEMEKSYVTEHNLRHPVSNKTRDILFMPSDNNSSSGAFLCMVEVNRELNIRGITTLVVLPSYGSGEELLQINNIDYTYVLSRDWLVKEGCSGKKDLQNNDDAIENIRRLIKRCKIKLVHNNTTYTYVGAVAAKAENIPVVWHLREYIKEQGYWFRDEEKAFQLINSSDAVIIVSDYIGIHFEALHVRRKLYVKKSRHLN